MRSPPNDDWMRIGELADLLGLTTRTLRYWEQRSLIPAAHRTPSGYRLYGSRHVDAARGIGRLKQAGFGLDEIRDLQGCLGAQATALADLTRLGADLDLRIERVQQSMENQRQLLIELVRARELLHSCNGCGGKPYDRECVRCLDHLSAEPLPDTLLSVLHCNSRSDNNRRSAP